MGRKTKAETKKPDATELDARAIGITSIIALIPIAIATAIGCLATKETMCCDSYYMLQTGRQILAEHAIPTTLDMPYGDIAVTWQNWLACIAYALAMDVGDMLGIGHIAVRLAHLVTVTAMVGTVVLISRRNETGTLATAFAVLVSLIQYSVCQTRVHALVATCLIVACESAMTTAHDKRHKTAWQAAGLTACLVATNIQHSLAIALPVAMAGIATLSPRIGRRERAETFVLAAMALAIVAFAAPPEAGSLLDGLGYKGSNKEAATSVNELLSVPDRIRIADTTEKLMGEVRTTVNIVLMVASAAMLATRRDKSFPLAIMAIGAGIMSFMTIRNQQMLCALMCACIACGAEHEDRIRAWHMPLALCLISTFMTGMVLIPKNMADMGNPSDFVRCGGEVSSLGFFNELMEDVPEGSNVLIDKDIPMGSWLYANGYRPSIISKTEAFDLETVRNDMLDIKWDVALVPTSNEELLAALERTGEWKREASMEREDDDLILLTNESEHTLREQNIKTSD